MGVKILYIIKLSVPLLKVLMAKANIVCRVLFMTLNFTETHATENVPVIHCLRSCVLCLGGFSSITCLQCRLSCIRTTWVTSRLDSHHNLAVSLNVDWFQPYSRVTDSLRSYILEYIEFSSSLTLQTRKYNFSWNHSWT